MVDANTPVITVEPWPGLDPMAAMWLGLQARADVTFYLTWHWIGTWAELADVKPHVLAARDGDCLVGLGLFVAAMQKRHRGLLRSRTLFLHETGDPEVDINCIEYNGFLVDRAYGAALERRMLEFALTTPDLPPWDEIRLGGVLTRYLDMANGTKTHIVSRRGTAEVDLEAVRASGRGYLDALSANTRYQTRRAMKLYGQRGELALDVAGSLEEALTFLEGMKALHQPYWTARGSRGAFGYPFLERFHRKVIARALPEGAVELLRVRAGDVPIGYLYNFIHKGWVGTYLSGFAYEEDPKLKPGYVSFALCVEHHLKRETKVVDFLAGELRYKTSLGRPKHTMVNADLQKPRLKLMVEDVGRAVRNRIRPPVSA